MVPAVLRVPRFFLLASLMASCAAPSKQAAFPRGFEPVALDDEHGWGKQWQRGEEELWVADTREPDYPIDAGSLRLRVEATRACKGTIPAVRKSFTLPPLDAATANTVLFFTRDGRAYQVGYARPLQSAPSKDALDFVNAYCGE